MSRGSGERTQISTQTSDPSPFSRQFLEPGLQAARSNILDRPTDYFPGTAIPPFSPETETALAAQTGRALAGSPLDVAGRQQLQQTLGGDFLQGGNPAYDALVDRSLRPVTEQFENVVLPRIRGSFSKAGRGGSNIATQRAIDAAQQGYLDTVGDVSARLAYPTFEAERARQMDASRLAPTLAAGEYTDIGQLAKVGAVREDLLRRQLEEDRARFEYGRDEPTGRTVDYMGALGPLPTATTTAKDYQPPNPLLTGLGAGTSLLAALPEKVGNPMGWAGAAGVLGGLGGLYFG